MTKETNLVLEKKKNNEEIINKLLDVRTILYSQIKDIDSLISAVYKEMIVNRSK